MDEYLVHPGMYSNKKGNKKGNTKIDVNALLTMMVTTKGIEEQQPND